MSHGFGRIQRQLLQILRSRSVAVDTAELARRVYLEHELTPAQRVAAWRALDGLEERGLVIRRLRRGHCYWRARRSPQVSRKRRALPLNRFWRVLR